MKVCRFLIAAVFAGVCFGASPPASGPDVLQPPLAHKHRAGYNANSTKPRAHDEKKVAKGKKVGWWCPVGQYSVTLFSGTASYGCSYCPAGKFQPNVKHFGEECSNCEDGKYQNANGQGSCKGKNQCGVGFFVASIGNVGTDNKCGACEAGRISATSLNAECEDCEPGFFQAKAGQGKCATCPEGKNSEAGASGCGACAAGQHDVGNTCAACAAGRYAHSGAVTCAACAPGTISGVGATGCEECPDGQHSSEDGSKCVDNVCTCENGVGTTGEACDENGGEGCASCTGNHLLANSACLGCKDNYQVSGGSCVRMSTSCCNLFDTRCCGLIKNAEGTSNKQCVYREGFWKKNHCHPHGSQWLDLSTCGFGYKC